MKNDMSFWTVYFWGMVQPVVFCSRCLNGLDEYYVQDAEPATGQVECALCKVKSVIETFGMAEDGD
jgi:hypothetical protein